MKMLSRFMKTGIALCCSLSSFSQISNALSTAPKFPSGKFIEAKVFVEIPIDKARKKIVEHIEKQLIGSIKSSTTKSEQLTPQQYVDFFTQFNKDYKTELLSIQNSSLNDLQKTIKRSMLEKSYAIAYSGQCMSEKDKNFIIVKDTDEQDMAILFQEKIRDNPRYSLIDDYQQGYARILKDGVYGFWDLCGNEAIPPQYEYAERFNDGKVLAKKFNWHFVNIKGEESEALVDVIDAKALKYGISIATFKNQKMALINNQYDSSKVAFSEEFDEIVPLTNDLLLIKEGKKFGILGLDGRTVANVIYDKITLEGLNELLLEKNKIFVKKTISNELRLVVSK